MSTEEELKKEQQEREAALVTLRTTHHDYRVLKESAPWNTIAAQFEEQAKMRENAVLLQPLQRLDDIYEQEFKKGEISSFRLAARYPALMMEAIEEEIRRLTEGDE